MRRLCQNVGGKNLGGVLGRPTLHLIVKSVCEWDVRHEPDPLCRSFDHYIHIFENTLKDRNVNVDQHKS